MSKKLSNPGLLDKPALWPINLVVNGIKSATHKVLGWGFNKAKGLTSKAVSKVQDGIKSAAMGVIKGVSKTPIIPIKK